MWAVIVLCACVVASGVSQGTDENSLTVTITQGTLKGHKAPNHDVFEFLDVPYASAPLGPNRFKAPLSPPIWMGTLDAVDRGIICPQITFDPSQTNNGREDCLVANIYVPNTNETDLPVLVIVHGGAFLFGRGRTDIPNDIVSSKNVIAVTFNYRLGPHGFLCLGTEDAPGNAGMKDQVALLQWVKNNIASFGGSPDDITIYGCSAGGASVDLLALSSMTDGLFNKVIAESGCSMNPFSTQINPIQNARDHAQNLGFTNVTDLKALEEFYKTTPLIDLFDPSLIFTKNSHFVFQPCVEKDIGQPRFLEDAPINILKSGNFKKLPTIYGYADREGLFRGIIFDEWSVDMNENFENYLPADLQFENEAQKVEVAQNIKEFYFGNNKINENTILEYLDYFTDVIFLTGILRTVALQVQAGHDEIYLYEYSFTYNGSVYIPHTNGLQGANHCDQYNLILDHPEPQNLPQEKTNLQIKMRDIIYNFIVTGNPTPPGSDSSLPLWPPASSDRSPHYSVGDTITVAGIPAENRILFWDGIYEQFAATPQPPIEITETDPTTPPEITQSTPQETESTTQELELTTPEAAGTTESPSEEIPDPEEIHTTPQPDSASALNIFSLPFWTVHAIIVVIAFK